MKESSHNIAKFGEMREFLARGYCMQVMPVPFY